MYTDSTGTVGEDYRGCDNQHFLDGYKTDSVQNSEWSCALPDIECYRYGEIAGGGMCYWTYNTCEGCSNCAGPCPTYF
jgi:hypothetical protein